MPVEGLSIGDLASTMSLAPLEQVTLGFQSTQRKVMARSVVDSVEALDSSESTTSDKEAVNVTPLDSQNRGMAHRCDRQRQLWQGKSSGARRIFQQPHPDESTIPQKPRKSPRTTSRHFTIEVRDVSEGLISNRMTRILRNPYYDRTLSVNVSQLLKYFNVQTALDELRTAILLTIDDILFDSNFVVSNGDFLREALIDSSLVDLPTAIQGASPTLPAAYLKQSIHKMSPHP